MKRYKALPFLLAALLLAGCSKASADTTAAASATEELFTNRDLRMTYSEDGSALITLSGDTASCSSNAVTISGNTVTITDEGTYILSGELEGMVIVSADDQDKVQIVLDNTSIHSPTSAAIYILEADKVFITTSEGSDNTLSNGGIYTAIDDNNIDAAVFSKADLTMNGEGALTIQAAAGHGVVSKDDLVLTSGTYIINAEKHGLSGKDCLNIAGGSYRINSGKDGLHAEHDEDTSKGSLNITGGEFTINAQEDGISSSSNLLIQDGTFRITTGGGASSNSASSQQRSYSAQASNSTSTKSIKASLLLDIQGGSFVIDSADDALHSNGDLNVSGGTFSINAGDDGIHADNVVTISGGDIDIQKSYEGIEGLTLAIQGGNISLIASDDGLNAAGGNDSSGFGGRGGDAFSKTSGACITISGGTLHINASGDGIDSNGDLIVTGGETYVSGPASNGNGTLDYNGSASITGGIFAGAGSSGMSQSFGSSSQGVIMVTVSSGQAGSILTLQDSSGNTLVSWEADKTYSSIIVSSPQIRQGETYTLTVGNESMAITMSSLMYSSGGNGHGMGNAAGGGSRGNPGGHMGGNPGSIGGKPNR